MTPLRQKLNQMKEARAKATKGHFETIRMDESSGYFSFMVEAPDNDDHIIGHFCEIDNPKAKRNAEFLECAANEWDALIDMTEKLLEVAEFYGDRRNWLTENHIVFNMIRGADEQNDLGRYTGGKFARETLAEINL